MGTPPHPYWNVNSFDLLQVTPSGACVSMQQLWGVQKTALHNRPSLPQALTLFLLFSLDVPRAWLVGTRKRLTHLASLRLDTQHLDQFYLCPDCCPLQTEASLAKAESSPLRSGTIHIEAIVFEKQVELLCFGHAADVLPAKCGPSWRYPHSHRRLNFTHVGGSVCHSTRCCFVLGTWKTFWVP